MKDELKNESVDNEIVDSPNETKEETIELLHAEEPEESENTLELLHAPELEEEKSEDNVELLHAPDTPATQSEEVKEVKQIKNEEGKRKIFEKYTSKDIVFLSIMAGCTLLTSAVMPLALSIHMFGVIHLLLGFQMSFFPALGLMKVRKPGALLYMTAVFSLVPLFIMPPIGVGGLLCALLTELIVLLIFRGYKKDAACITASALFFPMGLPFMYLYYKLMYAGKTIVEGKGDNEVRSAVAAMLDVEPGFAVGISIAIILLCITGAVLGALTFRKLKKSGAIKK